MNTLDWSALRKFIKDRKPVEVSAGILNDWFFTAATVWGNGKWSKDKHRAFVRSSWATPGFRATMANGDVIEVAAYRKQAKREAIAYEKQVKQARKRLSMLSNKLRASSTVTK